MCLPSAPPAQDLGRSPRRKNSAPWSPPHNHRLRVLAIPQIMNRCRNPRRIVAATTRTSSANSASTSVPDYQWHMPSPSSSFCPCTLPPPPGAFCFLVLFLFLDRLSSRAPPTATKPNLAISERSSSLCAPSNLAASHPFSFPGSCSCSCRSPSSVLPPSTSTILITDLLPRSLPSLKHSPNLRVSTLYHIPLEQRLTLTARLRTDQHYKPTLITTPCNNLQFRNNSLLSEENSSRRSGHLPTYVPLIVASTIAPEHFSFIIQ
jgi:hypothetical protein